MKILKTKETVEKKSRGSYGQTHEIEIKRIIFENLI
jgi:hypothetical protein